MIKKNYNVKKRQALLWSIWIMKQKQLFAKKDGTSTKCSKQIYVKKKQVQCDKTSITW